MFSPKRCLGRALEHAQHTRRLSILSAAPLAFYSLYPCLVYRAGFCNSHPPSGLLAAAFRRRAIHPIPSPQFLLTSCFRRLVRRNWVDCSKTGDGRCEKQPPTIHSEGGNYENPPYTSQVYKYKASPAQPQLPPPTCLCVINGPHTALLQFVFI